MSVPRWGVCGPLGVTSLRTRGLPTAANLLVPDFPSRSFLLTPPAPLLLLWLGQEGYPQGPTRTI